jgi:hypothetical protein
MATKSDSNAFRTGAAIVAGEPGGLIVERTLRWLIWIAKKLLKLFRRHVTIPKRLSKLVF